jgi:hypothetical protein
MNGEGDGMNFSDRLDKWFSLSINLITIQIGEGLLIRHSMLVRPCIQPSLFILRRLLLCRCFNDLRTLDLRPIDLAEGC